MPDPSSITLPGHRKLWWLPIVHGPRVMLRRGDRGGRSGCGTHRGIAPLPGGIQGWRGRDRQSPRPAIIVRPIPTGHNAGSDLICPGAQLRISAMGKQRLKAASYAAGVDAFNRSSDDAIFAALASHRGFTLAPEQRSAWQPHPPVLWEVLADPPTVATPAWVHLGLDIPRLRRRVDAVPVTPQCVIPNEFKVGRVESCGDRQDDRANHRQGELGRPEGNRVRAVGAQRWQDAGGTQRGQPSWPREKCPYDSRGQEP